MFTCCNSFLIISVESLYCNDPYLEDPYQEQSLAAILASQDFSSCELDKVPVTPFVYSL